MAKTSAGRPLVARQPAEELQERGARHTKDVARGAESGEAVVSKARFESIMQAARQSGLPGEKHGRIGGRVSPALVRQAKRQTGIQTDTDLFEFALASLALEDNFAEAFKEARGKIDPELNLGF